MKINIRKYFIHFQDEPENIDKTSNDEQREDDVEVRCNDDEYYEILYNFFRMDLKVVIKRKKICTVKMMWR